MERRAALTARRMEEIMRDITKYQGIIPAFYACYDENGAISSEGVKALTRFMVEKGVKGVYVGGSSGECRYLLGSVLMSRSWQSASRYWRMWLRLRRAS